MSFFTVVHYCLILEGSGNSNGCSPSRFLSSFCPSWGSTLVLGPQVWGCCHKAKCAKPCCIASQGLSFLFIFPDINLINFVSLMYMETMQASYGQRQRLLLVVNDSSFLRILLHWSWSGPKLVRGRSKTVCVRYLWKKRCFLKVVLLLNGYILWKLPKKKKENLQGMEVSFFMTTGCCSRRTS